MNELEVTFRFPTEEHRDDFVAWMSDGGGEYEYMEGQSEERPAITRFDYTDAWKPKNDEPPVVNCISDPDDE